MTNMSTGGLRRRWTAIPSYRHWARDHKRKGDRSMTDAPESRPPLPPFTHESAVEKVRKAEDAWNSRDPALVSLGYTLDSVWRNRSEFVTGRAAIVGLLTRKWEKELDYRLIKELWAFTGNRISVRFQYRIPHRPRRLVPRARQRAVGVRTIRPDASARGVDQRCANPCGGPSVPLVAARTAAGGLPRPERTGALRFGAMSLLTTRAGHWIGGW